LGEVHYDGRRDVSRIGVVAGLASSLVNFRGHLLETLLSRGHEVHTFGPEADGATQAWLDRRGIRHHALPLTRNAISPPADAALFYRLVREFRRTAIEVVLAYTIKPVVYALPAAALAGVARRYALITGLGYAFIERPRDLRWAATNRVARALYRLALRHANAVIFQNDDDLAAFQDSRIVARGKPTHVVNGSGVGEFLDAAKVVKRARPDATFDLVGPEEMGAGGFPLPLVQQADVAGTVVYRGEVADVRPNIARARIYVLPSYREGTPRSVLEAMSMGRPVIATDVPGCRAAVQHGTNGLLVPPREVEPLAAAMLSIIGNAESALRMGRESRRIAEQRYDVRKVTAMLVEICGL
jgi:glycosyltransferase involved in cell wall biosynthesis